MTTPTKAVHHHKRDAKSKKVSHVIPAEKAASHVKEWRRIYVMPSMIEVLTLGIFHHIDVYKKTGPSRKPYYLIEVGEAKKLMGDVRQLHAAPVEIVVPWTTIRLAKDALAAKGTSDDRGLVPKEVFYASKRDLELENTALRAELKRVSEALECARSNSEIMDCGHLAIHQLVNCKTLVQSCEQCEDESALRSELDLVKKERDEMRRALGNLLLSADCSWEESRAGHDWPEACQAARAALASEKGEAK